MRMLSRLLLLPVLLLFSRPAMGFGLEPISQVLAPTGSGASATYQVTNSGSKPIAVALSVVHLVKHVDGTEDLSRSAEDDFAIFPPQLVIEPGGERTVRIRWLGDPRPERELAYRLIAEQVPVELVAPGQFAPDEAVGQIRLYYTFQGTLFVRPSGARPDLQLEEARLDQEDDSPRLEMLVGNRGTTRGHVQRFELHLQVEGQKYVLGPEQLPALDGLPVLAGGQRLVSVPWPSDLPAAQPSSAHLSLGR